MKRKARLIVVAGMLVACGGVYVIQDADLRGPAEASWGSTGHDELNNHAQTSLLVGEHHRADRQDSPHLQRMDARDLISADSRHLALSPEEAEWLDRHLFPSARDLENSRQWESMPCKPAMLIHVPRSRWGRS